MSADFTIIVNTSDAYRDCWEPFFRLFTTYWPTCPAPILLNTERLDYRRPGADVHASRVQEGISERLSWSDCLSRCLGQVRTPLVLYLQEDYFLEAPVDESQLLAYVSLMLARPDIRHLGLTNFGAYGPFSPTEDPRLWRIARNSRYRISCQAALWRVDTLRSYLRPRENGWMFEIYGTRRARRRDELFLTVNRDRNARAPVFPYSHAGIIKGQWDRTMPALFARHDIDMDFSVRGFFEPRARVVERARTLRKLLEHPLKLLKGLAGY